MEDFTGFSFGGVHSSNFKIIATSNGDRYLKELLPGIEDYLIEIPRSDGSYYFGSNYKDKSFIINFSFDNLLEIDFFRMREWLNNEEIKDLVFDEEPYKVYSAKAVGDSKITFICFGERIYKGEGQITFKCHNPFAESRYNYLDEYGESYSNKNEWEDASGLLPTQAENDQLTYNNSRIYLSNVGDIPINYILNLALDTIKNNSLLFSLYLEDVFQSSFELNLTGVKDSLSITKGRLIIDSKKLLITFQTVNQLLIINNSLINGNVFKIPIGDCYIKISPEIQLLSNLLINGDIEML